MNAAGNFIVAAKQHCVKLCEIILTPKIAAADVDLVPTLKVVSVLLIELFLKVPFGKERGANGGLASATNVTERGS